MESRDTLTPCVRFLAIAMLTGQPVVVNPVIMTVRQDEEMLKRWYGSSRLTAGAIRV
jgi:hypothetical protein